eukprot:1792373-Prymnesium_polylepis.1
MPSTSHSYSLDTFRAVEKAAGRWSRKPSAHAEQDVRSLLQKREMFLAKYEQSEEEQVERENRRKRSIAMVKKALTRAQEHELDRPLRLLGCYIMVQLNLVLKNNSFTHKVLCAMHDKIKFNAVADWIHTVVPDKMLKKNTKLIMTFNDELGRERTITDATGFGQWIETNWARHPPELTIIDSQTLIKNNEQLTMELHDLFDRYDNDKSGGLSISEVKDMLLELDMGKLNDGISRSDISAYVSDAFTGADHDGNGVPQRSWNPRPVDCGEPADLTCVPPTADR